MTNKIALNTGRSGLVACKYLKTVFAEVRCSSKKLRRILDGFWRGDGVFIILIRLIG
ncbi:MAG TPA: hypothetical protein VGQ53_21455 [Chitinophagaceae bacterium]|nr:hypothetical protein [Chitinophagaceae bacterium]